MSISSLCVPHQGLLVTEVPLDYSCMSPPFTPPASPSLLPDALHPPLTTLRWNRGSPEEESANPGSGAISKCVYR